MNGRETIRVVQRMLRQLRGRINGIVRRAIMGPLDTAGAVNTSQVQTRADDADDRVEHFEPHGFSSAPPPSSEGLVFRVGGQRDHQIAAFFHKRGIRPSLEQGEVTLYHEDGARVTLRNDGAIEAVAGAGGATLTMNADGSIDVHSGAGQTVNLGGAGGEAVARATDPVHREAAMATWMSDVEAYLSAIAAGFNAAAGTPVVALGSKSVVPPVAVVEPFASINAGGIGSTST